MRNAYFGLLLVAFFSITSSSDLSAQSPSTAAPPPLLATPTPAPIYFLTKGVWVTIGDKDYGFGTGTQFELVQDLGKRVVVRNGDYQFEIDRARVTTDIAVAKQAYDAEIAKITAQQQEKAQEQETAARVQDQENARQEQVLKKLSEAELVQLMQSRAAQKQQRTEVPAFEQCLQREWQKWCQEDRQFEATMSRLEARIQQYEQWNRTRRNTLVIRGNEREEELPRPSGSG